MKTILPTASIADARPTVTVHASTQKLSSPTLPHNVFPLNHILIEDCISGMSKLPSSSFDIAIADPPYNLSKGGAWKWDSSKKLPGFGGDWQKVMQSWDNMSIQNYITFTMAWLTEIKRLVRPTGSLWIHGTYHNIGFINVALQLLGIEIINEITWYKRNSFPNLSARRLTASHETILWAHTGSPKKRQYFFDYDAAKNTDFPEDHLKEKGKQLRTVWDVPNNKDRTEIAFGKHPTQKPLRLLFRMIRLSARPGQSCLVPFAGAGSECVAAVRLGLHFFAFETDHKYAEIARSRVDQENELFSPRRILVNANERPTPPPNNPSAHGRISGSVPPLIKWTGSKRSQASRIFEQIPPFRRYFEPFVGGGALLYFINPKPAVASDIYKPLIDFWRLVRENPEEIIESYAKDWEQLQQHFPDYFYSVRTRFNNQPTPHDLSFLSRTCVNGIIRFNAAGEFNNSFHLSRKGMQPERFAIIVRLWSRRLQNVEFRCCDYQDLLEEADNKDFIYFDPPYLGSHNRYAESLDSDRFFSALEKLNSRNIKWALSFDGMRGDSDLRAEVPASIYKRHLFLSSGHSSVKRVLSGDLQNVQESLYLNF